MVIVPPSAKAGILSDPYETPTNVDSRKTIGRDMAYIVPFDPAQGKKGRNQPTQRVFYDTLRSVVTLPVRLVS